MNLTRANMELMGLNDINSVLKIDAPAVSTNCEQFVKDNGLGYYVCINTWLYVVKDYSVYGWMNLAEFIRRNGLNAAIASAQDAADQLIKEQNITDTLWAAIWHDLCSPFIGWGVPRNQKEIRNDPLASMLMVLRYPKRLSPIGNDKIQAASIKKFLEVENRTKLLQRREMSRFILPFLKEEASQYLDWDSLVDDIDHCLEQGKVHFTSGVGYDSRSSIGSKLHTLASSMPDYFTDPFGIKYTGVRLDINPEYWADGEEVRPVKVQAVPKSYKASRIIAMEATHRQVVARAVGDVIDRHLPRSVRLHDQSVNQKLARYGSQTGELATLDLSNASDCISKSLFWEIFPYAFTRRIYPLLGTHTEIDGKRRLMQQMSTAGNALTFILESMVFDIICRAAASLGRMFGVQSVGSVTIDDEELIIPSIYGDDMITDTRVAELTVEVLTALGFVVNEAKSYLSGPYRESCGAEYYAGVDVSGVYFPRFPLEGSLQGTASISSHSVRDSYNDVYVDTLTSLISLQHRLFGICYPAARFIFELVREARPKMTVSLAGSLNSDLWDYVPTFTVRYAPYARLEVTPSKYVSIPPTRKFVKVEEKRPEAEREYKFAPVTKYTLKKEPSAFDVRLFEVYRYRQFLEFGPSYDDELMKLLGVSSAPLKLEQAFGEPEVIWVYRENADK